MIVDTDVLIWYFGGNPKAEKCLLNSQEISISAVTLMELIQGAKNKRELNLINKFLHENAIRVYYINEEINLHAIHLLEGYTLSHGTEWGDALIAATVLYHGEKLLTANIKHYAPLPNIELKKFAPH